MGGPLDHTGRADNADHSWSWLHAQLLEEDLGSLAWGIALLVCDSEMGSVSKALAEQA